jgi:hypothetical protein
VAGTWFKQMHGFYRHPKTKQAGEDAANLFVRGIDYCTEFLTDGFIPDEALDELSRKRDVRKHAESLVRVGYWERSTDEHGNEGWWVHNFHDFHPTKREIEEKRDKDRRRKGGGNRTASPRRPAGIHAESTRNDGGIRVPDVDTESEVDADLPSTGSRLSLVPHSSKPLVARAKSGVREREAA